MVSETVIDPDIEALEVLSEEIHELYSLKEQLRKRKFSFLLQSLRPQNIMKKFRMLKYHEENPRNFDSTDQKNLMHRGIHRTVIYTCITGGYDLPIDPVFRGQNIDYVIFTDSPEKIHSSVWKARAIPDSIADSLNPSMQNRYIKMHPFEIFGAEYDYSIYIDGNIRVISDLSVYSERVSSELGIALHLHRARDCAYDEAEMCMRLAKGNIPGIKQFINKLSLEKFPRHFGLAECNMIVVKLDNTIAQTLLCAWWNELLKSNVGRDQLVFPYVVWKLGKNISSITTLGANIYRDMKVLVVSHKE